VSRIGVAIITGFLGSGKTTVLREALRNPSMARTAVIVNEFGSISLDHLLIEAVRDNVIELRNGCICCSIQGDLLMTLRDLHRRRVLGEVPDFDYVIVETSGLADPVPLAHTFTTNAPLKTVYALDVVIAVVDALNAHATALEHPICASQIAFADLLLVTKTEALAPLEVEAVGAWLRTLNQCAEQCRVEHGQIAPEALFRRGLFEPRTPVEAQFWPLGGHGGGNQRADDYATVTLVADGPLSRAGTLAFLDQLGRSSGEDLLRVKGLVSFAGLGGRVAVIHGVRQRYSPIRWLADWPDADRRSRLVVIGQRLDRAALERDFRAVCVA
jgi:G3E family GTPase